LYFCIASNESIAYMYIGYYNAWPFRTIKRQVFDKIEKKKKMFSLVLVRCRLYYFLTSTILESKIWESPHISQPHGISHHGQNKIHFVGPVPPGFILISTRIIIILLLEEQSTKCLA